MFNPELFMSQTVEEANSTEILQVPEGEYLAVSDPVTVQSLRSFDVKRGPNAGSKGHAVDIQWTINDEDKTLSTFLGRTPRIKQSIMLEIAPDGTLAMGKGQNADLGRTREALNQNTSGRPWSFSMLGGAVAKVKVKHRLDAESGKTFAEVKEVAKA